MIWKLADNVTSPLGTTTEENYRAVKAGKTALERHEEWRDIPEIFTASLFTPGQCEALAVEGLSRFESLAFQSARDAIVRAGIDVSDGNTAFILSTTKANIELLGHTPEETADTDACDIGGAAKRIAQRLGFSSEPWVVCNACISGVSAITLAQRLLEAGACHSAVVCGADVLCPFTVAGFLSLKAVSADECRPFDMERTGLNLGEAAATIVLVSHRHPLLSNHEGEMWGIARSAVRNDAYHISSPSRDGSGACRALQYVLETTQADDLAVINAHGTATLFNDQMESVAIEKTGLNHVPVNALKGYFGHTLGAAGILETVITMAAIDDHTLLATRGYESLGVSGHITVLGENCHTQKNCFVKMISGFGGGNGALLCKKTKPSQPNTHHPTPNTQRPSPITHRITHRVRITPSCVWVDGIPSSLNTQHPTPNTQHPSLITRLYKQHLGDYPKFYKMDPLCQLGLIASELLLKQAENNHDDDHERAVILFNSSSSVVTDKAFLKTIASEDGFFPSPSLFVYTLPNMVTAEIAIRNQCYGETSLYISPQRNDGQDELIIRTAFSDTTTKSVIGGRIDYDDDRHFEADVFLAKKS